MIFVSVPELSGEDFLPIPDPVVPKWASTLGDPYLQMQIDIPTYSWLTDYGV